MPKAEASKVQVGERLALFNYYTVTSTDKAWIHVKDEKGNGLSIARDIVDQSMTSTTQFQREEEVTRTRLANIIGTAGHAAFRVTFTKAVEPNAVADALADKIDDVKGTQAKRRKVVREAMRGEERVMHCRLCRSGEPTELGRYQVIDLEAQDTGKHALRLVDTRTVSEVVIEGTRYFAKK